MGVHLLLVGIDGLRLDVLDPTLMPNLQRVIDHGARTAMTMPVPTDSGPGWSTLLTGASIAGHGVTDNGFVGHRLDAHPDLLSLAAAAHPGLVTAAGASWPPLVDPVGVGPVVRTREPDRRAGRHRVIARDGETYGYRTTDSEITRFAVPHLRVSGPDVSFVYLGEVDEAGHLSGSTSSDYAEAAGRVDEHLGRMVRAIELRVAEEGERWVVAVTTDHGHLDEGGHGGDEPEVTASFVVRRGWGVVPDPWPARIAPEELTPRLLAQLA